MDERGKTERARRSSAAVCVGILFALGTLLTPTSALSTARAEENACAVTELVPVGKAIGVKLFAEGVLVVALSEGDDIVSPAKEGGIKIGDIILTMNDVTIESTEHLQSLLAENGEAQAAFTVRRGSRLCELQISPQKGDDGTFRLGAWIRDSMAGIGTMTFYDPQSGTFAALGHGITDVDTGKLMPLSRGAIMPASVKAVKRGLSGSPGELRGDFDLTRDIGTLYANTDCGIFGKMQDGGLTEAFGEAIPIASRSEVKAGKATILANCEGNEVCEYTVEIEKVYSGNTPTRNMLLRVTDERLLQKTGGIVQGLSGSPIVQNGKLIGAVTHVLVDDPCRGYGILIENMLDAAGLTNASV